MARDAVSDADALGKLPLLEFLPPAVRAEVARRFVRASYPFGAVIVREGDPADALYVLVSGRGPRRQARRQRRGGSAQRPSRRRRLRRDGAARADHPHRHGAGEQRRRGAAARPLRLRVAAGGGARPQEVPGAAGLAPPPAQLLPLLHRLRRVCRWTRSATCWPSSSRRRWRRATLVIREGDPPGPMYVVEEGRLRVFVEEDGERRYIRVSAARRLLRRAVAVQARGARGQRRGGRAVHAAAPDRGDLHPPADRATRTSAPSSRSASRSTTTGRWRACRWTSPRRRCRPSCACRRRSAPARSSDQRRGGREDDEPRARPSRRRRDASSSAPSASDASRTCASWTRWTAAPPAWPWSAGTTGARSASPASASSASRPPTARACGRLPRARPSWAWPPAPSRPPTATCRRCRSPAIVHWEGNHWVVLYDVDRQPRADRRSRAWGCAGCARADFERALERLRRAVRLHRRLRPGAGGGAQRGLALAVRAAVQVGHRAGDRRWRSWPAVWPCSCRSSPR